MLGKIFGPLIAIILPKPKVRFSFDELVEYLMRYIKVDDLTGAYDNLKINFGNPFKPGDVGVWQTVRNNIDLIMDVVYAFVQTLERITIGGEELAAPEKLEIAAEALDRLIKVPWYFRPFTKPLFKLIISVAVGAMNAINWQPLGRVQACQKAVASRKGKIQLVNKNGILIAAR